MRILLRVLKGAKVSNGGRCGQGCVAQRGHQEPADRVRRL